MDNLRLSASDIVVFGDRCSIPVEIAFKRVDRQNPIV